MASRMQAALIAAGLAVGSVSLMGVSVPTASAQSNGLAATPPMGFNDWNAFKCNVSASLIEQTALAMHTDGMQKAGYQYVNIDDCWLASTRTSSGQLQADPTKFPDGIAPVAAYVHKLGLKLGIYEDAGTQTCAGYPGSLGHESQDAATFASWGVDYLKYDQCNIPFANYPGMTHEEVDQKLYTTMSKALKATGRNIVFSMCTGTDTTSYPWLWGGPISNLWRTTPDIQDNFASMVSNVDANAALAAYAGPGGWNDPDMLEIGNGGMTTTEYQSEMSLWSIMAAPLISGTTITSASSTTLSILENKGVIAVDQDRLGKQGRLISDVGGLEVFAKPLAGGDVAVALFNSTDTATTVTTSAKAAGLPKRRAYLLDNLWTGARTSSNGTVSAFVPAHGTTMYRISTDQRGAARATPSTVLSVGSTADPVNSGASSTVTVQLTDDGTSPIVAAAPKLALPEGWRVRQLGSARSRLLWPNESTSMRYQVTAPTATTPVSSVTFEASENYLANRQRQQANSSLVLDLVAPVSAPLTTANTTGGQATLGQVSDSFAIVAAGTGVSPTTTTTRGTTPASDQYAAIVSAGAADATAVAQTTVTAQAAGRTAQAGLQMRNSMGGSPAGVALYVTGSGAVGMSWNASGGAVVDTASTPTAAQTLPVTLKLVRDGSSYTGYYSTDGGTTWVQVAVTTVAASASAATQDVGIYHDSGTAEVPTEADFTGFSVNG